MVSQLQQSRFGIRGAIGPLKPADAPEEHVIAGFCPVQDDGCDGNAVFVDATTTGEIECLLKLQTGLTLFDYVQDLQCFGQDFWADVVAMKDEDVVCW